MRNGRIFIKSLLIGLGLHGCVYSPAQSFLGLSINYGDKLTFTPDYPSMLLDRRSFSPTIVYSRQTNFRSGFSLIYGAQVGIAGYQLAAEPGDTLNVGAAWLPISYYAIFLSRLEIVPGKVFHVRKKEVFIGIGGGVSYYFFVFPFATMSLSTTTDQGDVVQVFSAYIESPESGVFSPFAKLYAKVKLSRRFDMAFQYSRHWKSILTGEFEFYHTQTPASGTIKLVPQGISLIMLYRLRSEWK